MFEQYIETYGQRLFALCLKLCANTWEAQDLYQETWLKAYCHFARYDSQRDFEPWLVKICINTYRDIIRRQKVQALFQFFTNQEQQLILDNLPAEETNDEDGEVRQVVNGLPQRYRLVILLYYFYGCSVERTAKTLGIPQGTVKSRLSKARSLLKERLKEYV